MLKKNVNKETSNYYFENKVGLKSPPNPHHFIINSRLKNDTSTVSATYSEQFYTVPLILYYYSRNRHRCEINPQVFVNQTLRSLNAQLEKETYRSRLKEREIQLDFLNVPGTFYQQYTSHTILIPLVAIPILIPFTKNEFYYREGRFVLRYLVLDPVTKTKLREGTIEETLAPRHYIKARADNRKSFLKTFVAGYDTRINEVCEKIAVSLLNELNLNENP